MKDILKKIDIIYIIGLLITLIGIYFKDRILLSGDFLYGINNLFTPFIEYLFIIGGIVIIVVELIITKKVIPLYKYLVKLDIWFVGTLGLSLVFFLLSRLLAPAGGFVLLMISFVLFGVLVLMIKTNYLYFGVMIAYTLHLFENFRGFYTNEYNSPIYSIFSVAILVYLLVIIVYTVYSIIKKRRFTHLIVLFLVTFVSIFQTFYSQNTYTTQLISPRVYTPSTGVFGDMFDKPCIDENLNWYARLFDHKEVGMFDTICEEADFGVVNVQENAVLNSALIYLSFPIITWVVRKYGVEKKEDEDVEEN